MAKLPRLTGTEPAKIVAKLGFIFDHKAGCHMVFKHPDGRKTTAPNHSGEEIGPGLLTKIIKYDFKVSREEFFAMVK